MKVPVKSLPGYYSINYSGKYSAITRNDGIRRPFGVADTPKAACSLITSDKKSEL